MNMACSNQKSNTERTTQHKIVCVDDMCIDLGIMYKHIEYKLKVRMSMLMIMMIVMQSVFLNNRSNH